MRSAIVAFVLSVLSAALLTPRVRDLAVKMGAVDHAYSSRKVHGRPIPRLGGLAIAAAFYAPLLGMMAFQSGVGALFMAQQDLAIGLIIGGTAIVLLGVYDDLRGSGAAKKFVVQFGVAGLMYALGFRIETLANPFGQSLHIGWIGLPLTLFWIVGIINAMNLIDGLDGLAGGVALVAVAAILIISLQRGNALMTLFCAALGGSILGFLIYNFNPASIFMGDTGSMFLGFILATTSIQTSQKASTTVAVLVPLTLLGIPILDTLLAVSRRAMTGRPLFRADREHIHHRLLATGLSHRQAVLVLYGACVVLAVTALVLTVANGLLTTVTLGAVAVLAFVFLRWLGYMSFRSRAVLSDQRRRSRDLRALIRPFTDRLRQSNTPSDIWEAVRGLAGAMGACGASLHLSPATKDDPEGGLFSWGLPSTAVPSAVRAPLVALAPLDELAVPDRSLFCARFGLIGLRHDEGHLELRWNDGRTELDRSTEISVELFCDHVAAAHERAGGRSLKDTGRPFKMPTGGP